MATADTIRAELIWTLNGDDWAINALHFTTGAAGSLDQDEVSALALSIGNAFTASGVRADFSDVTALARVRCRDLRTDGNPVVEGSIGLAGTSTGPPLPRQTCTVATLRTSLFSRRGRGRIYFPALGTNSVTDEGLLGSGAAGRLGAFVNDLLLVSAGDLGNLVLAVLSRTDNVSRSVTAVSIDSTFDVQTRRRDVAL